MAEVLLGKVIGAGGFEKPVAVKRMLPSMAADPQFVELFLHEARLTVALQHPNIVQVHDFGEVKGHYYQVLEFVDGENLRQVLTALAKKEQRLSVAECCHVVQQVAEGLAYAHAATTPDRKPLNIIHRDINPANVMVSRIGEVKLADFGIAKAADGRASTQVGVIKGKAGYLSPEQVLGGEVDQRSDLFLMGLMLHELLGGKRMFEGPNYFNTLKRIAAFDPRQLAPLPDVPPQLWTIVVQLLAPDPAQRMPSARALSDALQAFLFDARLRVSTRDMAALFTRAFPERASPLEAEARPSDRCEEIEIDDAQVLEAQSVRVRPKSKGATVVGRVKVVSVPAPTPPAAPQKAEAPAPRPRRKLGEILLAQGKINAVQLERALKRREGLLGERLTAAGVVAAIDVVRALAEQNAIPFITDEKLLAAPVPTDALERLAEDVAARYRAVPVAVRGRALICAMENPLDHDAIGALRFAAGAAELKAIFATEGAIRAARERFYRGAKPARPVDDDWRGRVPDVTYGGGLRPFADRVTGTRERYFDEADLARRMSDAEHTPAVPPQRGITWNGLPPAAESGSLRLTVSASLGGLRKVLLISDRADHLELGARLMSSSGVQLSIAGTHTAEAQLAVEQPDLVVVASDGAPQAAALARQLAFKAPGVEVRVHTLAAGVLGEGPAMSHVSQLQSSAIEALAVVALAGQPGADELPAAARLCRQVAGWLGGGRAEQERAAALLYVVAAANRLANRAVLARADGERVAAITGGDPTATDELLAIWAGLPQLRARPAAAAVAAVLAYVERAGGVLVGGAPATTALARLESEAAMPAPALEALRALVFQGESSRDTVVVVDIDPVAGAMLQQRLIGAGLSAVLARSGAEARELMKRGARALVATASLPDTEGPALIAAIRADRVHPAPILYLLANDTSQHVTAALDAGADDVMVKPVNAEVIAAKLRRALGVKAARAS